MRNALRWGGYGQPCILVPALIDISRNMNIPVYMTDYRSLEING